MNKKILGSFEMKGNQLIVSDPCYPVEDAFDKSDILSWVLEPAKSGEWESIVFFTEDFTITKLIACHRDVELGSEWTETGKNIGVDSAMAGIIKYYLTNYHFKH